VVFSDILSYAKRVNDPKQPSLEIRIARGELGMILLREEEDLAELGQQVAARRRLGEGILEELERKFPSTSAFGKENQVA